MMVNMLALVLDSNAIHRDPWLASDTAKKLLGWAEVDACVIVYPQLSSTSFADNASRRLESHMMS